MSDQEPWPQADDLDIIEAGGIVAVRLFGGDVRHALMWLHEKIIAGTLWIVIHCHGDPAWAGRELWSLDALRSMDAELAANPHLQDDYPLRAYIFIGMFYRANREGYGDVARPGAKVLCYHALSRTQFEALLERKREPKKTKGAPTERQRVALAALVRAYPGRTSEDLLKLQDKDLEDKVAAAGGRPLKRDAIRRTLKKFPFD